MVLNSVKIIMSRPTFGSFLKATTLRLLGKRRLLCAAGLVLATGSAVYFYNKYYGVGEDEQATVEIVDRVVTVEEDHDPTLDQEDPVLVQYVGEEVWQRPCLALIPWSGPLWVPSCPTYYLTHAGRMLVRELAVLNTQFFTNEQHIFISHAGTVVWDELFSQPEEVAIHMQYVDEEVQQRPCLSLVPWSGPLWVSSSPVKLQPTYYLTHAGNMLVRELSIENTQIFRMEQPMFICFTPARRMAWEETSSQNEQPNSEDSGFPYEKMQLVENWGSFHFHSWIIRYGRVQQNEEDMHHLCIVRGVEKQLWWSRVIQEKILDPWGIVQVVLTNQEVTGIKFLGRRIYGLRSCLIKTRSEFTYYEDAQQVDISTTVEGFQERGDDMMAYQFSTSDIITTPHEPSSGSSHQFPQDSPPPPPPPPFPSDSPPSPPPPYHFTKDKTQDQTPDSTPQEFVEEQHNVADVPQLRSYFGKQGITNFSLRLAAIRRAMEALTSSDSTSLNYLTHAGRMVLSGLSELNQQDVRQFQQAYDILVNFITEPANRERLELEMALVGISHINFTDVFYEFVLLSLLEGKTSPPTSSPGSFFYLLMEVIMRICPPGGAWTESAGNFYLLIKDQMKACLDSIFNLDESIYESPQRLSGQVMRNLEMQVEFLLSSLD